MFSIVCSNKFNPKQNPKAIYRNQFEDDLTSVITWCDALNQGINF